MQRKEIAMEGENAIELKNIIYDYEKVSQEISKRTGLSLEIVEKVLDIECEVMRELGIVTECEG